MRIRPLHLAAAVALVAGAVASGTAADAAAKPAADQPVSRFVAYQACQAAMWHWTEQEAALHTAVAAFRHTYRAQDVWAEHAGWHVQVGGTRGEPVTANDDAEFCLITGTNAHPKVADAAYPR